MSDNALPPTMPLTEAQVRTAMTAVSEGLEWYDPDDPTWQAFFRLQCDFEHWLKTNQATVSHDNP